MTILARRGLLPTLLFLGSMALYAATMIRTAGWLDDTLKLSIAYSAEVSSWVNNHNLFTLLGHLWLVIFSFLDPHAALTLLCGLFASVSVLFAYHAGREVTGNPLAGALAAAALAVSHSIWWHATVVEAHSLNAALISLDLFFIGRFFRAKSFPCLCAAFFLFGIGVFNHALMGLFAVAYGALFVMLLAGKDRIGWRKGLLLAGATILGCVPYLIVLARDVVPLLPGYGLFGSIMRTLDSASGSFFRSSMFPRNLSPGEHAFWKLNYLFLLWYNFPAAALPLAAWGTVRLRRGEYPLSLAVFFWLGLAAQVIWSSNYLIWDMFKFSMPVYVLASLPLAVGIDVLLRSARPALKAVSVASLLLPAAMYPLVTTIPGLAAVGKRYIAMYPPVSGLERQYAEARARASGLSQVTAGVWDPVRYLMNPARAGYREVAEFCGGVLKRLPPSSHYWDDDTKGGYPIQYYYQGLIKERPDVSLHLLFSLHVDEQSASAQAQVMRSMLDGGGEFFVSTIEWPERELLIQLSRAMRPDVDARSLRLMAAAEFRRQAPGLVITPVPLGTRPGLAIYRVSLR
ncbi:MAG TPA: hypothetical protein VMU36_00560 [Spirochaetia bacterium]|nr:hypothetical protein [Spirochaetia bacterium]